MVENKIKDACIVWKTTSVWREKKLQFWSSVRDWFILCLCLIIIKFFLIFLKSILQPIKKPKQQKIKRSNEKVKLRCYNISSGWLQSSLYNSSRGRTRPLQWIIHNITINTFVSIIIIININLITIGIIISTSSSSSSQSSPIGIMLQLLSQYQHRYFWFREWRK